MCVAAAIAGGAVASAGIGAISANSAANTQANADNNATQAQMSMFNTITGNEQPFMQAGGNATTSLLQALGLQPGAPGGNVSNGYLMQTMKPFDPSEITSSPGYQFAQNQGMQQIQNSASASTGAMSGAALKALSNFTTGTAAQYYNDYFNQYNTQFNQQQTQQNNIFDRLSSLAGLGQNAAANVGNSGTQLGTGAAQSIAAGGAASAAGTVGASNALSSGISSASNMYALNNMLSGGSSGGSVGVPGWTPAGS